MAVLEAALEAQPRALAALSADLRGVPTHAYLFSGPAGSGKARAARAFAAELLADGSRDPSSARSRALADPSPHPDLEWVTPPGNQHLVETIRERVIFAAPLRPFEGERRVFVIEGADALAEESQNALLMTLEEPPPHAHLILICSDAASILATVRSRCRQIAFAAPGESELVARLAAEGEGMADERELLAAARLSGGDFRLAAYLVSEAGRRLRAAAERCAAPGAIAEEPKPWLAMIELASEAGERAGQEVSERAAAAADEAVDERTAARLRRDGEEAAKRAVRRERTRILTLGLRLWTARLRDLEAAASSAEVLGCDRGEEIAEVASAVEPDAALRAAGLVGQAHRRLRVNVAEELALESLAFAVAREIG